MNLPTLPTDNLYKFVALTSMFFVAISVIYLVSERYSLRTEIVSHEGKIDLLELKRERTSMQSHRVKKKLDELAAICNCGFVPIVNDSMIIWQEAPGERNATLNQQARQLIDNWSDLKEEGNRLTVELNSNTALIQEKNEQINEIETAFSIAVPLLGLLVGFGFSAWYHKTQRLQDYILKMQFLDVRRFEICQSCGIDLFDDDKYQQSNGEERRKTKHCSECWKDGHFIEPDLSVEGMVEKIKERCRALGLKDQSAKQILKRLNGLERWSRRFNWRNSSSR